MPILPESRLRVLHRPLMTLPHLEFGLESLPAVFPRETLQVVCGHAATASGPMMPQIFGSVHGRKNAECLSRR